MNIVLDRVPAPLRSRLRDVFIRDGSRGVRRLGRVSGGRRDIELYAYLPPRVSLRSFMLPGQAPQEFGAPSRGQWPPWAVRRFLLYDVLLHELGHLQVVNPRASRPSRKYASETRAHEFANELRRTLWSVRFQSRFSVHDPPAEDELAALPFWQQLDKKQRLHVVLCAVGETDMSEAEFRALGELEPVADRFMRDRLGLE